MTLFCHTNALGLKSLSNQKPTTWPRSFKVLQHGATVNTAPGKVPKSRIPLFLDQKKE